MVQPPSRPFKTFLTLLFSLSLVIWLVSRIYPSINPYFTVSSTLSILLFGLVCFIYNIYLHFRGQRWHAGTTFLSFALISYGIGEVFWYYYSDFLHLDLPYPSFADIWYSLFYPLVIVGLVTIILKVQNKYGPFDKWAGLLGIIVFSVGYFFLVSQGSQIFINHADGLKTFFDISYLVWDALLLVMVIVLAGTVISYSKKDRYPLPAIFTIGISLLLMLLGDTLFSYTTDLGTYQEGNLIDLIFLTSTYLLALSALRFHDSPFSLKEK